MYISFLLFSCFIFLSILNDEVLSFNFQVRGLRLCDYPFTLLRRPTLQWGLVLQSITLRFDGVAVFLLLRWVYVSKHFSWGMKTKVVYLVSEHWVLFFFYESLTQLFNTWLFRVKICILFLLILIFPNYFIQN